MNGEKPRAEGERAGGGGAHGVCRVVQLEVEHQVQSGHILKSEQSREERRVEQRARADLDPGYAALVYRRIAMFNTRSESSESRATMSWVTA